jgi:ABC-2 type transport system permease protein
MATSKVSSTGHGLAQAMPAVLRGAARQARIELRIQLFSPMVFSWLAFPIIGLVVLYFLRDQEVMGTAISLAQIGVPGMLAMTLITSGVLGVAGQLVTERDDGTLLRAKATPHGVLSHLLGNVLIFTGTALGPVLVLLVAAAFLFDGITPADAGGWFTFAWVSVLGLLATLPLGALMGAVLRGPIMLAWASLIVYGAMAISGIFYPIGALPGWLQGIGQVSPIYWLGLGLRASLLPPEAVALELGGSWHLWETAAVLGAWSALGLVLAPMALRRMARRQSGSQMAAARDRVIAQGY